MRRRWMMGWAITVALLVGGHTPAQARTQIRCPGATTAPAGAKALRTARRAVRCLVNVQRAAHHLPPLRAEHRLGHAALAHTRRMLLVQRFSHRLPGREPTLAGRAAAAGYLHRARRWWLGETLAFGTGGLSTPFALVGELMASPRHRATLLDRAARDLGVGLEPGAPGLGAGATLTLDLGRAIRR
jgi:uncharacterized protein YkwD